MADYKEMYNKLFNKVTDIIDELQQIQRQTEELYIQSKETEISLAHDADKNKTHS